MEKEYYLLDGDERTGPFTYSELVENGLDVNTQLSTPFSDKWKYASEMPEFIDYFKVKGIHFPTGDNLAHFGIKAAAFIVDYLILFIPLEIIFINMGIITLPSSGDGFSLPSQAAIFQLQAWFSGLFLIYHTLLEISPWKGSIGKKIFSLVVVDVDGNHPTFLQTLGRNMGALLSLTLLYGLPFLSMLFNEHRQNWYDGLTKTYVVKTN
jgi:uncharacterized RDD family membrane protein YckC